MSWTPPSGLTGQGFKPGNPRTFAGVTSSATRARRTGSTLKIHGDFRLETAQHLAVIRIFGNKHFITSLSSWDMCL